MLSGRRFRRAFENEVYLWNRSTSAQFVSKNALKVGVLSNQGPNPGAD